MKNRQEILDESWEKVNEELGYPNVEHPKLEKGNGTAFINMLDKNITVYEDFVDQLGIYEEYSIKGILAHEANHYVKLPYDFKNHIFLTEQAKTVNESLGHTISNYYCDVVINLDLIEKGFSEVAELYKAMDSNSKVDNTIKELYQIQTGIKFKQDKSKVDRDIALQLAGIDYRTDKVKKHGDQVVEFGEIIKPILLNDDEPNRIDNISYDYQQKDIDNTIKEYVDSLSPGRYASLKGMGESKYDGSYKEYYDALSKKYYMNVEDTDTEHEVLEENLLEWEPGVSATSINPLKSKGKFLPGITYYKEETIHTEKETNETPNALILFDSSASMKNPYMHKSHAVIAGYCLAEHYIGEGSQVAVANFSSNTKVQDYTGDKEKIQGAMLEYQDGGTILEVDKVTSLYNKGNKPDIYVISDLEIANLNELESYFNNETKDSRVNIFNISPGRAGLKENKNITTHVVDNEQKLPGIVIPGLRC